MASIIDKLLGTTKKKKSSPATVQARLKKRLEKKIALAKSKADNAKLRTALAKVS